MKAYKDKPMIPNIHIREQVREYIPMLLAYVTGQVMNFQSGNAPQKTLYKKLVSKGFNNESFTQLFQIAADYFDYLKFGKLYTEQMCYNEATIKACDIYVALYIKENRILGTLPSGTRNYYEGVLNEYPELNTNIIAHHQSYDGIKGEKHVYNQQAMMPMGMVPGQVYQDPSTGAYFTFDQTGRPVAVPMTPQQLPNEVRYANSMARRNHAQYAPVAPVAAPIYPAQTWGQNPGIAQPMMRQSLGAMPPNTGGYAAYSNQGQNPQEGGIMTPYSPGLNSRQQQTQQPNQSQQQPYQNERVVNPADFPPPERSPVSEWANNSRTVQAPAHMQNNQRSVEADPPAEVTVFKPITDSRKYNQVGDGYETPYYWTEFDEWDTNRFGFPVIYDANRQKAMFRLDKNKKIVNLTFIRGDRALDIDMHENAQFFTQQKNSSSGPDKNKTLEVLATVQRNQYIKETLAKLMDLHEGNVTGNVGNVDLKPVEIKETLIGNATTGREILYSFYEAIEDNPELQSKRGKVVFSFNYAKVEPIRLTGDQAKIALEFRDARGWFAIRSVLQKLDTANVEPALWTTLNTKLTDYVNDVIKYVYGLDVSINSFDVDIEDLLVYLEDEHKVSQTFKRLGEEASAFLLNVIKSDDPTFTCYFEEEGIENEVAFVHNTDVTILPLTSEQIFLPVPYLEDDEPEVSIRSKQSIVTKESFPELYAAIDDRISQQNPDSGRMVFVTLDGLAMIIHKASNRSMYIIERE